jgi:nucleotide-binding universal stress UspA family protein
LKHNASARSKKRTASSSPLPLRRIWTLPRRVVRHGSPGVSLREYATETSADLIATGSEDVPRLQAALLGRVSLDVVTRASRDVPVARSAAH